MTDEKIARINALAKKAKTEGLTDAERRNSRNSVRSTLPISARA